MSTIASILLWAALAVPVVVVSSYFSIKRKRTRSDESKTLGGRLKSPNPIVPQNMVKPVREADDSGPDRNGARERHASAGSKSKKSQPSALVRPARAPKVQLSTKRSRAIRGYRRANIVRKARARINTRQTS